MEEKINPIIGIAVGRNTHTVIVQGEGKIFVENCIAGVKKVLALNPEIVVFAGNKRWAMPFAYSLKAECENGCDLRYQSFKTDPNVRGAAGSIEKQLRVALEAGMKGNPFFVKAKREIPSPEEPESYRSSSEEFAHLYFKAANEVRRAKHTVLNKMVTLFPEAVKITSPKEGVPTPAPQPPDLFTKKMRVVLENPFPETLQNDSSVPEPVRVHACKSLALYVPPEERREAAEKLRESLKHYDQWLKTKQDFETKLREEFRDHGAVKEFGDGILVLTVLGFLSWKTDWKWREIRKYCGLDVSRVDGKGKLRISRRRPMIRSYIYLLITKNNKAREVASYLGEEAIDDEIRKRKMRRVKRIERFLKYLRNNYLSISANSSSRERLV